MLTAQKSAKKAHSAPATTLGLSPKSSQHSNGSTPVSPITTQESPAQYTRHESPVSPIRPQCTPQPQETTSKTDLPAMVCFSL